MGYAVKIYEAFQELGKDKALILAEFVEHIEKNKAATYEELRQTELRLIQQIEQLRKEIKEIELKLTKQIKDTELKLTKQIQETKASLIKWMFLFWTGQIIAIASLINYLLKK